MAQIDPKVMAFRKARANDLKDLARFTNKQRISIEKNESFKDAIRLLENNQHVYLDEAGNPDVSLWGYTITHLPVIITAIPRHTFPAIKQLTLRISMAFAADWRGWEKMQDPARRLNLDVLLLGTNKDESRCLTSYHLDKHQVQPIAAGSQVKSLPAEVHPLYHVQFSSGKTYKVDEAAGLNLGTSGNLFLDPPRLLHYPMDLILGVDFILANYLPGAWNALQRDGSYANLCRKYQTAFLKPYIHAIAQHWDLHRDADCWGAKKAIWPNLL